MAGILRKLAGETAIYGLSTILARMINFFFVPIYTRVLTQGSYGSYTEIMSYIAVLQVVLVLGLETGCFKFANGIKNGGGSQKDSFAPFSSAFLMVCGVSLLFFAVIAMFAAPLSDFIGCQSYRTVIYFVAGILVSDSITAVLFAKLRYEQKAVKFALFKTIKIVSETGFNLLLFFFFPGWAAARQGSWLLELIPAEPHFSYIILAVFLSCVVCFLLFIPELFRISLKFDRKLAGQMLLYSIPLMVAGLPGIINDGLDRLLFRFFSPEGGDWRATLGVYQAAVKLAVIMNLFIQMFRYAAEPFFFAREREKNSKELYAKVMEYFIAFCMFIFLGVLLYMDLLGLILGRDFRGALGTVPFMLFSYMLLGILFNVSMWYKLSGHTKFAVNITLSGLAVTAVINMTLMPYFSYWASVAAHLLSALVMLLYSLRLGNKYYPVPYRWRRIMEYIAAAIVILLAVKGAVFVATDTADLAPAWSWIIKMGLGTAGIVAYAAFVYFKNRNLRLIP